MGNFYTVRPGLLVNLECVSLVMDKKKHYESYPKNELCVAHLLSGETWILELKTGHLLNITPDQAEALLWAVTE